MTLGAARLAILGELYGQRAGDVGAALDGLLARHRRAGGERPDVDERTAWVIAYPDHVTADGEAPLTTLDAFVGRRLAPAVTGVHTLPLHPSSSDGGFSVVDPAVVDPAFGDWADIDRLAADRTWMADFVVNHLSAESPWFHGFLADDPRYADFFTRLPEGADTTAVVRPRTTPIAHRYESVDGNRRIWTTFSADQVDLEYRNPAVLLAMIEVLLRYLDHGARAVRLDAVAFLWKDPATPSIHLPETHALVALFRLVLAEVAPDVVLVTETNVPHAENVAYFGSPERPEAHAVYQFALPPLVAHAALSGDTAPLVAWADSLVPAPDGGWFLNFLSSHDGIGLRPVEGLLDDAQVRVLTDATRAAGGVINRRSAGGSPRPYELAVSWFDLLGAGVDEDTAIARHVATHAVALALAGIPLLYLNSLFGVGNDAATYATTRQGRDLNRQRLHADVIEAELADPTTRAARVWSALRDVLERRAADPRFAPDAPQRILDTPPGTFAVERAAGAVVIVNLTDTAVTVGDTDLPPWGVHWPDPT